MIIKEKFWLELKYFKEYFEGKYYFKESKIDDFFEEKSKQLIKSQKTKKIQVNYWHKYNAKRTKEWWREYYRVHKERYKIYETRYVNSEKGKLKIMQRTHSQEFLERARIRNRKFYQNNKEKVTKRNKIWYQSEKGQATRKKYKSTEKFKQMNKIYQARYRYNKKRKQLLSV